MQFCCPGTPSLWGVLLDPCLSVHLPHLCSACPALPAFLPLHPLPSSIPPTSTPPHTPLKFIFPSPIPPTPSPLISPHPISPHIPPYTSPSPILPCTTSQTSPAPYPLQTHPSLHPLPSLPFPTPCWGTQTPRGAASPGLQTAMIPPGGSQG